MNLRILTTLLLVATTLPVAAEVVRSVDKDGNVHFRNDVYGRDKLLEKALY